MALNLSNDGKILLSCTMDSTGSIVIPDTVVEIGDSAFKGCSQVTSVIIPDSVVNIAENAFDGCCTTIISSYYYERGNDWKNWWWYTPKECTLIDEKHGVMYLKKGYDKNSPINLENIKVIRIGDDAADFEYECRLIVCDESCSYPTRVVLLLDYHAWACNPNIPEGLRANNHEYIANKIVVSNGMLSIYKLNDEFLNIYDIKDRWSDVYCEHTKFSIR